MKHKQQFEEAVIDIVFKDVNIAKDELIQMASGLLEHWYPKSYLQRRMKEIWKKLKSIMVRS